MAEENNRYNEEGGGALSSFIGKALGAAGAVGTSVALLRSHGQMQNVARAFQISEGFMGHMSKYAARFERRTHSTLSLRNLTYRETKNLVMQSQRAAKLAWRDRNDIRIATTDNRGLWGAMLRINMLRRDPSGFIHDAFIKERVINPLVKEYRNSDIAKGHDLQTRRKFENYIHDIAGRVHKEDLTNDMAEIVHVMRNKKYGFHDTPMEELALEYAKKVGKIADPKYEHYKSFKSARGSAIVSNAIDEFLNIDNLLEWSSRKNRNKLTKVIDDVVIGGPKDPVAKVREIVENADKMLAPKMSVRSSNGEAKDFQETVDSISLLKEMASHIKLKQGEEAYNKFMNMTIDDSIKVNAQTGELYSTLSQRNYADKLLSVAASTIPGKILKMRDMQYAAKAPNIFYSAEGSYDPILAAMTNEKKDGQPSSELESSVFNILGKAYRVSESGELTKLDLPDIELHSGQYGATQHLIHQIAGDIRRAEPAGFWGRALDIGTDRDKYNPNRFNFSSIVTKHKSEDWIGNEIDNLVDPDIYHNIDFPNIVRDGNLASVYLSRARDVLDFARDHVHELSQEHVQKLLNAIDGKKEYDGAREILELLKETDNEILFQKFNKMYSGEKEELKDAYQFFSNKSLANIYNQKAQDWQAFYERVRQVSDRQDAHMGSSLADLLKTDPGRETELAAEIFRVELGKEAILRIALGDRLKSEGAIAGRYAYDDIVKVFEEAGITSGKEALRAKTMATTAMLENATKLEDFKIRDDAIDALSAPERAALLNKFLHRNEDNAEAADFVKDNLRTLRKAYVNDLETFYESADEIGNPVSYNQWITLRRQTSVMDILSNLNNLTKAKAAAIQMFKEIGAGRGDMENVSLSTLSPYFMLSRLSDEANNIGLGFSSESMGSTFELAKSIITKRIIPASAAIGYYEWMDDTSQEVTGMSVSGAMAQGVANVDVSARRLLDFTGLTDWLKTEKKYNPIMQYWGDHNEFQSADERAEWYANGYEPYRKGAWWTFGGVNEARGSEIQFWQPNFVRRIQSDYEDKALYDGYWDKWSHSWLPTPTNPFSPLFALLDPYHYEEEHADDRPYQLSGTLFSEGTPWGAVLNPTIGEIIKPQKKMHPWRDWHGVDPLALLHDINMQIRQKAQDWSSSNLIQLNDNSATPVDYVSYNAPTANTSIISVQTDANGNVVNASGGVYGVYEPSLGTGNIQLLADSSNAGPLSGGGGNGIGSMSAGGADGAMGGGGTGGFTKFSDDLGNYQMNALLLEGTPRVSLRQALSHVLFSNRPIPTKAVAVNEKGELGVYSNIPQEQIYSSKISLKDELMLDRAINGDIGNIKRDLSDLVRKFDPTKILEGLNAATKARASQTYDASTVDEEDGFVVGDKLKNYSPTQAMDLLNDPDTVTELINQEKGKGFVDNASVSWRLIAGIYGYGVGAMTGIGADNEKRIATAGDMFSFSRTFWDSNVGGAGGGAMEIARRFIPNYRRSARVNNLMNEMPDWLPERFKYGDAFTQIIKGEMRLPGEGYEALNELHPDQFADDGYGAFDRMKILADIAPFSPEYKVWKKIAQKTVTDPRLIEEMDAIRDRVNQQGKKHDFYNYNVVGRGLEYKNIVVSEVLGYGKFKSGNTVYKMAGVSVTGNENESQKDVLARYLHPGQEVTIAVDENAAYAGNKDSSASINAAVFSDGENLSQVMLQNGDATVRKGDTSASATLAQMGPMQKMIAWGSEIIAHADIPWLSDQYLRVRTPLESYKAEQVYGTPYQTWEHPIDTFLMPAIERAFHDRSILNSLGTIMYRSIMEEEKVLSPYERHFANAAFLFGNRGAFIGGALSVVTGSPNMKAAEVGSQIATLGHALTGGSSYLDAAASWAELGYHVARYFERNTKVGALAGAAVGALYHSVKSEPGRGDWIPDRVKKRWEYEDYFDRLTYIKYMGLYHAAAEKAKDEEDVDVEELVENKEEKQEIHDAAKHRLTAIKKALQVNAKSGEEKSTLMKLLNKKLNALEQDATVIEGGEWTRTALLYKQTADATMFALKKGSSWSQVITALPTNDREYFMEFVKESDPDKRKEILRYVSPSLQRALKISWGEEVDEPESNEDYFRNHDLPVENWRGWSPNVDLKDVEVKTIANEAMNLSDFGFYESQLRDPAVQNAPTTRFKAGNGFIEVRKKLNDVLKGKGLEHVDISVQPGTGDANTVIANIGQMLGFDWWKKKIDDHMKNSSN